MIVDPRKTGKVAAFLKPIGTCIVINTDSGICIL